MGKKLDYQIALTKYENWLENIAASTLYVLNTKEGFGEKRLKRFLENWTVLWNEVSNNITNCEDFKRVLREKYDIDLKKVL